MNGKVYMSLVAMEKLEELDYDLLDYPSYSPDLTLSI